MVQSVVTPPPSPHTHTPALCTIIFIFASNSKFKLMNYLHHRFTYMYNCLIHVCKYINVGHVPMAPNTDDI